MNKQSYEFVHFVLVGFTKHWALKVWELDSGVATLRLTWMQFRQLDKYPAQIYSTVAGRNWNDLLHTSYKTTADWNLKANINIFRRSICGAKDCLFVCLSWTSLLVWMFLNVPECSWMSLKVPEGSKRFLECWILLLSSSQELRISFSSVQYTYYHL